MRQAREIIRLKFSTSLPTREIADAASSSRPRALETLSRLDSAGLSWPLPEGIGDAELEAALTPIAEAKRADTAATSSRIGPRSIESWKRKHVHSADRLGRIYRGRPRRLRCYSRFWRTLPAVLKRSCHRRDAADAARRASGCSSITRATGQSRCRQVDRLYRGDPHGADLRRRALATSSFTLARASWTQALPDWIDAHVRKRSRRSAAAPAIARAGQYEDRRHQSLLSTILRSIGPMPKWRRSYRRCRHFAGAAAAALGQSEG